MSFASPTLELIRSRHSMRAFLPTPVPREIVAQVLQAAAHAPSSKNTQPWQVVVLTGAAQAQLSAQICARFDQGIEESPDYVYTPDPWPDGFLDRARECGYGLFALKGIDRKDRVARRAHDRENFTFFGAPLTMIFHLSAPAERGMFLDMGLFLQNVMLGLWAHGIGSCPQFSLTSYSDTIRAQLGLEGRLIVCGLSAGYPDPDALVNTYVPPRLSLDAYVRWME
jgi:nitroreductase